MAHHLYFTLTQNFNKTLRNLDCKDCKVLSKKKLLHVRFPYCIFSLLHEQNVEINCEILIRCPFFFLYLKCD